MGDRDAVSTAVEPPPPRLMLRAWWRKHWKKLAAVATLPFAAIGGLAGPPPGGVVTWSPPTTSTVVPMQPAESPSITTALLFRSASATGAEYNFSPPWALHASTVGQEETVRLASSIVDAANKCAGGHWLSAQIRRNLIQFVLLGIGGVDPADATDILEFAADNAEYPQIAPPKLGELIGEINRQVAVMPPEKPGATSDPPSTD